MAMPHGARRRMDSEEEGWRRRRKRQKKEEMETLETYKFEYKLQI